MFSPPPDWTWANTIAVGAGGISLIALGFSIATFVQRYRLNPQPKLIPDWGRGDLIDPEDTYVPIVSLLIYNHGDAAARDVKAWVSTRPQRYREAYKDVGTIEPGKSYGWINCPLTSQYREGELDEYAQYPLILTVPKKQAKWERPVVTVTWRQAPFSGRPRRIRFPAPKHLLGPPDSD